MATKKQIVKNEAEVTGRITHVHLPHRRSGTVTCKCSDKGTVRLQINAADLQTSNKKLEVGSHIRGTCNMKKGRPNKLQDFRYYQ